MRNGAVCRQGSMRAVIVGLALLAFGAGGGMGADGQPASRMVALGDKPGEWTGATPDAAVAHAGRASALWEHGKSERIVLANAPSDWTTHTGFGFWLHNKKAGPRRIILVIQSEDKTREGMDYYACEIPLTFTGWKRFEYLRSGIAPTRHPLGWDKISGVHFAGKWGGKAADPANVVHVAGFELVNLKEEAKELAMQPYLDGERLFDEINVDFPGLGKVKAAVEKKDYASAKHEMAEYLRGRPGPGQATEQPTAAGFRGGAFGRPDMSAKDVADKAVAGEVAVVSIWHKFPGGKIDWHFNATENRKDMPVNTQWISQLHRMQHWPAMVAAYNETGDETYARAWVEQMRTWVRSCPRLDAHFNQHPSYAWRTINVGIRMLGTWNVAFYGFLKSPSFTDDAMMDYLQSCIVQGDHLRRNHTDKNNWLSMEMNGLYTVAITFPELRRSAEWKAAAIETQRELMDDQFLPDGAQIELTPGYHGVTLKNCMSLVEKAKRVGILGDLPADYVDRLQGAYGYFMWLGGPDGSTPHFNDSGGAAVAGWMAEAVEYFPDRADFRYFATGGKEGKAPSETSHAFDWAGYYVMRSGWEKDANYLCFDAGPLGMSHVHQDKLNVVCQAFGRRLLFDGGGGEYEQSEWRDYAIDTPSHNCVLVDGMPQRRITLGRENVSTEPLDAGWQSTREFDFAVGVYDGIFSKKAVRYLRNDEKSQTRPAEHTRRVLFVKPDLFVIVDTLTSLDGQEHAYEARWHLLTTSTVSNEMTRALVTTDAGEANLALTPLVTEGLEVRAVVGQEQPELLGWDIGKRRDIRPATTLLHTRRGKDRVYMVTLLAPLRAGEGDPVEAVRSLGPTSSEVKMRDGRTLRVEWAGEPRGGAWVTETLADGSAGRTVAAGK